MNELESSNDAIIDLNANANQFDNIHWAALPSISGVGGQKLPSAKGGLTATVMSSALL